MTQPQPVPVVWSPDTRRHDPHREVWVGVATTGTEVAARVDAILDALRGDGHRLVEAATDADDRIDAVLASVHDADLLEFLRTAAERWAAGPYERARRAGPGGALPLPDPGHDRRAARPAGGRGARRRRPVRLRHDDAGRARAPGRRRARPPPARSTAADLVVGGEPLAYALCRPPGHHATPAGHRAAPATSTTPRSRRRRCATPATSGSGSWTSTPTRATAPRRSSGSAADVLYGSVHVDPGAGWFPHVVGYADETGAAAGAGATRNRPLPEGTGDGPWLDAVDDLAGWVVAEGCTALVVSLGVDAAADDPESPLLVTARRLPRGRAAARRHRAAGRRGAGGRLPPAHPRQPGGGVPRRATRTRAERAPAAVRAPASWTPACAQA